MVKKKRSRLGSDRMKWGALGEVTNVANVPPKKKDTKAPVENLLKVKDEDNQKWWSIGRSKGLSLKKKPEHKRSNSTRMFT